MFGLNAWSRDRAQRAPCAMTYSQIFFRPAQPYSVNKHLIIPPLLRLILLGNIEKMLGYSMKGKVCALAK